MLDIRLYGRYRALAENKRATDDSKLQIEFKSGETVAELLARLGIDSECTGEILVNFAVSELDTIIPREDSRIAIFPEGMVLLCGASHLRGHSYSKVRKSNDAYYGKPEVK